MTIQRLGSYALVLTGAEAWQALERLSNAHLALFSARSGENQVSVQKAWRSTSSHEA